MALGTNHSTITTSENFIPELWSDEVIGAYKSKLVVANTVTKMSHKGKKGDRIHIPVPARGAASVKAAGSQVTLIADTAGVINVAIDKHYEYYRSKFSISKEAILNGIYMKPLNESELQAVQYLNIGKKWLEKKQYIPEESDDN